MSIKQAIEALESCDPGDYSTGHVIHPSYDEEKVNDALDALRSMPADPVAIELDQALKERDDAEDMADQLADQIAAITGAEIGEHTSANDPWRNAMFAADQWIAEDLRRMFDGRQEQPRPPVAHRLRNAPSEIDYDLLIAACYEQTRQAQGTKGCVQFAKGAEWYRELISATPHTEADWADFGAWAERDKGAMDLLEKLIDVWDDGQLPHEHRCYVDGAWAELIAEARAAIRATKGGKL